MGYYMRYLFEGEQKVTLEEIEAVLKKIDDQYAFLGWVNNKNGAEIQYQKAAYGTIELERFEGEASDKEIQETIEKVELIKGWFTRAAKSHVIRFLKQVRVRIVVRVLWGGRETEETLGKLDPLWEWLTAKYAGLLQVDGEGFYDKRKLILKMK